MARYLCLLYIPNVDLYYYVTQIVIWYNITLMHGRL